MADVTLTDVSKTDTSLLSSRNLVQCEWGASYSPRTGSPGAWSEPNFYWRGRETRPMHPRSRSGRIYKFNLSARPRARPDVVVLARDVSKRRQALMHELKYEEFGNTHALSQGRLTFWVMVSR